MNWQPDPHTVAMALRASVSVVFVFVAWAFWLIWRCRACDAGGRWLVLVWLGHALVLMAVNLVAGLILEPAAESVLFVFWSLALLLQAAVSVILYVTECRKTISHRD